MGKSKSIGQFLQFRDWRNNSDILLWSGRTIDHPKEELTEFSFSGSGFTATFEGTWLKAKLYSTNSEIEAQKPYLIVSIDGIFSNTKIVLDSPSQEVTLASGLKNGRHIITVYKITEAIMSHVFLERLETDGCFHESKTTDVGLNIEFYGDSITTGYQVESNIFESTFETKYQNALKTYAFVMGDKLKANISLICASGFPLFKSAHVTGYQIDNIPDMIHMATIDSVSTQLTAPWDNSRFKPDYIIINLGANDCSILENAPDQSEFIRSFKQKYMSFIQELNQTYGTATTVLACSGMVYASAKELEDAIDEAIAHFPNVRRFWFHSLKVGGIMPGRGHPNIAMHYEAGLELAKYIQWLEGRKTN